MAVAPVSPDQPSDAAGVPQHWDDLRSFVSYLEARGELKRITREIDPVLELSEIAQRAVLADGPALLFERVKGSQFPALINTYATKRRMSWALGVPDLEDHARSIGELVKAQPPVGLMDKIRMLPKVARVATAMPRTVRRSSSANRTSRSCPSSRRGPRTAARTSRCPW
jgi:4-hydroxy-3-polyprenylbenzoate decarboxylase